MWIYLKTILLLWSLSILFFCRLWSSLWTLVLLRLRSISSRSKNNAEMRCFWFRTFCYNTNKKYYTEPVGEEQRNGEKGILWCFLSQLNTLRLFICSISNTGLRYLIPQATSFCLFQCCIMWMDSVNPRERERGKRWRRKDMLSLFTSLSASLSVTQMFIFIYICQHSFKHSYTQVLECWNINIWQKVTHLLTHTHIYSHEHTRPND